MTQSATSSVSFDTLDVGDELPIVATTLDRDLVKRHAHAMDMTAGRFTDDEAAKREGLPGQITPGNMSLGLLASQLLTFAPQAKLVRLGTTFRGLALAGTEVRLLD